MREYIITYPHKRIGCTRLAQAQERWRLKTRKCASANMCVIPETACTDWKSLKYLYLDVLYDYYYDYLIYLNGKGCTKRHKCLL